MSGWTHVKSKKRNANTLDADDDTVSTARRVKTNTRTNEFAKFDAILEAELDGSTKSRSTMSKAASAKAADKAAASASAAAARKKAQAEARAAAKAAAAAAAAARPEPASLLASLDAASIVHAARLNNPGMALVQGQEIASAVQDALAGAKVAALSESALLAAYGDANSSSSSASASSSQADGFDWPLGCVSQGSKSKSAKAARAAVKALAGWIASAGEEAPEAVTQLYIVLVKTLLSARPNPSGVSWAGTRLLIQVIARVWPALVAFASDELVRATQGKSRKNYNINALYVAAQLGPLGYLLLLADSSLAAVASTASWPALATALAHRAVAKWRSLPDVGPKLPAPAAQPSWAGLVDPNGNAQLARSIGVLLSNPAVVRVDHSVVSALIVNALACAGSPDSAAWLAVDVLAPLATAKDAHPRSAALHALLAVLASPSGPAAAAALAPPSPAVYASHIAAITNILAAAAASASPSSAVPAPIAALAAAVAERPAPALGTPQLSVESGVVLTDPIWDACSANAAAVNGSSSSSAAASSQSHASSAASFSCASKLWAASMAALRLSILAGVGISLGVFWNQRDAVIQWLEQQQQQQQ